MRVRVCGGVVVWCGCGTVSVDVASVETVEQLFETHFGLFGAELRLFGLRLWRRHCRAPASRGELVVRRNGNGPLFGAAAPRRVGRGMGAGRTHTQNK